MKRQRTPAPLASGKFRLALILLLVLHLGVVFAGFLSPYGFAEQHRDMPFAPPARLHFFDRQGRFHARPFVYALAEDPRNPGAYVEDFSRSFPLRYFVQGSPYKTFGFLPARTHLFGVASPARVFLLGTDGLGRDQFSRFLYGGEISLFAGVLAAMLSLAAAVLIGGAAGFYGGRLDDLLMRSGELFLALPWLYLLFAVRAALPLRVSEWQIFLLLVSVIGLVGWSRPARLIRGIVLSARERNFVTAARGFGAGDAYLLRRHVLPQTYPVLLTQFAVLIPQYVLAEVTLTFVGLGVGEPMPSWGTLLAALQHYYVLASYWWMFLPAALLVPVFLAYYMAADALQERLGGPVL